jgi:ATPase subunit of ABC transporter with duplicated ATPase domains
MTGQETVMWVRKLSNTFDGQRYQFRDVTLSLAKGQKVGLVGVNGCGKSTLLRALGGREVR